MSLAGWDSNKRYRLTFDSSQIDADLTDFVAPVLLDATSGQTAFDMTAVFNELTPLDVDDDFTGTDGDPPDVRLWTHSTAFEFEIIGNKLNFSTSAEIQTARTKSKYTFPADFEIQVDFDLTNMPDSDVSLLGLYVANVDSADDDALVVDVRYQGGHKYFGGVQTGGSWLGTTIARSETSGKLKIVRSGSTFTGSYWNGSSWVQIDSRTCSTDTLRVYLTGVTTANLTVSLNFDNFTVNSGIIVWPETPKKIAFEVGDTGAQCYGEIVSWDYNNLQTHIDVKVPSVTSATDAYLLFYADAAHADNTTYIGDTNSAPSDVVHADRAFVSHQAQDPSGTAPQILDSSPNAKHGTSYGTMTSSDLIDGLTGKALDYDSIDDFTNHGYDAAHDITDVLSGIAVIRPSVLLDSGSTTNAGIVSRQHDPTDLADSYTLVINTEGRLQFGSQGGSMHSTKSSWAAGVTYVIGFTYNATGLVGNLFIDGVKETLTVDSLDAMAGSTNNLVIGKNADTGDFFPGMIDEAILINGIMSDAWFKVVSAALRDNLITFSLPIIANLAFVDMPYGDLIAYHQAITYQPYTILFSRAAFIEQLYGIKIGSFFNMHYGNSPELQAILNQYYDNSPVLKKICNMPYENTLMIRQYYDMPYIIPFDFKRILEMRYSLAGETLVSVLNQQYSLLINEPIRKKIDQIYMLQEGNKLSQVSTSVIIGGSFVNPHHVNVEYSIDSFVASGEVHLASEEEYIKIHQGDDVEITINGETHIFIVDAEPKRSRSGAAKTNYIIECVSPAIKLTSPWSNTLTCLFDADTASNIFEALAHPIIVDWKITNFPIIKDTLYANNEDRMSVMRKITQSAGAIIQPNPDGSIRVVYRYPKAVIEWETSSPDYYLTDSLNFISQDETFKHNSGINKYIVSNASTPEDRIWIEQDEYPNVIAFEVPWKGTNMSLEHSGGSGVMTPEYMGTIEIIYPPMEEDPEQIEFVAGFSNTSRPIYTESLGGEQTPIQITWIRESLGSLTISEDGRLEAEYKTGSTDGYSLATIRYLTRYKLWRVNNGTEKNVQYILRIDGDYDASVSCS